MANAGLEFAVDESALQHGKTSVRIPGKQSTRAGHIRANAGIAPTHKSATNSRLAASPTQNSRVAG